MSAWGSWDEMTQLMKYLQRRHAAIHSSTSTSMFTSHIFISHFTHQLSSFTFHMSLLPTPFGTCSSTFVSMSMFRVSIRFWRHQSTTAVSNSLRFSDRNIHPHSCRMKPYREARKVPIRRNVLLSLRRSLSQLFSASPKCVHGLASVESKKRSLRCICGSLCQLAA